MAHCSLLGDVAATSVVETENVAEVVPTEGGSEVPVVCYGGGHVLSELEIDASRDGGASDNENSRTYYFGASTITLGHIREMAEKGYFVDGEARAPGAETIPELDDDKVIVFEEFFVASLHMAPHSALADILL
jgi:hypothetical protein